MSAIGGQTSDAKHPASSSVPQPETTNAYTWVTPSDIVFTQTGPIAGAKQGEGVRILEANDSQASYLAFQLELERGCVRELMQQNEKLSHQAYTREFLQNYPRWGMQYQGHGLHYGSGGAIPEMYYWRDGYDSYETTPKEGYYDSFTHKEYGKGFQGNYGF
jgi:hypothetical protein